MAQLDGTGPQGQGPMTGRGAGNCGKATRRGLGRGCFGMRGRFFSKKNEQTSLETEKEMLEEELKAVNDAIEASKDNS